MAHVATSTESKIGDDRQWEPVFSHTRSAIHLCRLLDRCLERGIFVELVDHYEGGFTLEVTPERFGILVHRALSLFTTLRYGAVCLIIMICGRYCSTL